MSKGKSEPLCFSCTHFKAEYYHANICSDCYINSKKWYKKKNSKITKDVQDNNTRWGMLEYE